MSSWKTHWHFVAIGLLALCLRLPLTGDQPYTDEGIYAAASYFIHLTYTGVLGSAGWPLPKEGVLSLYPLLTSWVYFLPMEPFFVLRVFDAVFAATAGMAMYRFLAVALNERHVAFISAIIFVLALNHPVFVNAGYKNSIMIAMTLTALSLAAIHEDGGAAPVRAGLFMAGAVLFREFFLPMAVVVALYTFGRSGRIGLLKFSTAGLVLGLGTIAMVVFMRGPGGLDGLVSSYRQFDTSIPHKSEWGPILNQGVVAGKILIPLVLLVGTALFAFAVGRQYRNRVSRELYLLGVILALCPAVEIWYKPAFPYHFSQAALGLTVLCALGLRATANYVRPRYTAHKSPAILFALIALGGHLALFHDYARFYYWQAISAARFAPVMIAGNWKSSATEWSIYLRAARFIRENSLPSATMMTEFVTVGLFPLTHRMPSPAGMGNLRNAVNLGDRTSNEAAMRKLLETPPDILVLMQRPIHFEEGYDVFPTELARRYSRRVDQTHGLSPYGSWSAQIYLLNP